MRARKTLSGKLSRTAAIAACALMICAPTCLLGDATASATEVARSPTPLSGAQSGQRGSWTIYHGAPAGTGVALGVRSVNTAASAWTSPTLDGQIYSQPPPTGQSV